MRVTYLGVSESAALYALIVVLIPVVKCGYPWVGGLSSPAQDFVENP